MKTLNFQKLNGLIPAIIQNDQTNQVLMLGFMNKESLQKTISSNEVWFYSRTKQRLWKKGEESGNSLSVVSIEEDCDQDTLLIRVNPKGPTCHTGEISCFKNQSTNFLGSLFSLIQSRKEQLPENSYTTSLFKDGLGQICAKVEEESLEVIQAAQKETRQRLIEESSDLIYHLFVLMVSQGVSLKEVCEELKKRDSKN